MNKRDPEFVAGYVLGCMLVDLPIFFGLAVGQILLKGSPVTGDLWLFVMFSALVDWLHWESL